MMRVTQIQPDFEVWPVRDAKFSKANKPCTATSAQHGDTALAVMCSIGVSKGATGNFGQDQISGEAFRNFAVDPQW